jgi:hypothetical protein
VKVGTASLLVLPAPTVSVKALDRPGIRKAVVEASDLLSHTN